MPTDSEAIAAVARDAAAARSAAESVAKNVARLVALAPTFALDVDHPKGATYIVDALAGEKRWVQNGTLMANLLARYPIQVEKWSGSDLAAIPTVGAEPPRS